MVCYRVIDHGWIKHRSGRQRDAITHDEQALVPQEQIRAEDPQNFMARVDGAKKLVTTCSFTAMEAILEIQSGACKGQSRFLG